MLNKKCTPKLVEIHNRQSLFKRYSIFFSIHLEQDNIYLKGSNLNFHVFTLMLDELLKFWQVTHVFDKLLMLYFLQMSLVMSFRGIFCTFLSIFYLFPFVTEKDGKTCFNTETNDFYQQMVCKALVRWSKYTTDQTQASIWSPKLFSSYLLHPSV